MTHVGEALITGIPPRGRRRARAARMRGGGSIAKGTQETFYKTAETQHRSIPVAV